MILKKFYSKKDARSVNAFKNIVGSFFIKGGSIIINLALVPLTIDYLNPTKYGIWLTISSIMGWINFFDIGLGHGLRNKLTQSIVKNDMEKSKAYVSTAYFTIAIFCSILFLIFFIVNHFLNWNGILNITDGSVNENLNTLALIVFSMFSMQFILQLINSILLSTQNSAKVSLNNMISNVIILVVIYIVTRFFSSSLLIIAFIFSIMPVVVLLGANIFYFKNQFKEFSPNIKYVDFKLLKDILNLGVRFFIIQITFIVIFQTANILICRYASPEMVTPYTIAFRYFGVLTMISNIILSPYWSAYTEAYEKNDLAWIESSTKKLLKIWLGFLIMAFIMLIFSKYAYKFWVGDKVKIDFSVSVAMMIYVILMTFGNVFIVVINGIGKVKLQVIVSFIGMVIIIPVSYYLSVVLNFGLVGIIVAITICNLYGPLVAPFQVKKIFEKPKPSIL